MKKVLLSIVAFCLAVSAMAVPAKPGPIKHIQPDGTEITIYLHGDEFYHYVTDAENNVLKLNSEGYYLPTGETQTEEEGFSKRRALRKVEQRRVKQQSKFVNHAPRGLVILVEFNTKSGSGSTSKKSSSTFKYSRQDFDDMLNKDGYVAYNGAVSCAREYFETQSYGQYSPQFDVYGPYQLKNKMTYYGGSSSDSEGEEDNPYPMIKEACQMAHDDGVDFSIYDNDNDGEVDFVFIFYAGYGQADSNINETVWPHMWWLERGGNDGYTDERITFDGKKVNIYACSNEICYATKGMEGISTFCHEFSHVMGFPDLYDTKYRYQTLGSWDVMDGGTYNDDGYTPPCYSSYERFYAGWIKPVVLTDETSVVLDDLNKSGQAYLVSSTDKHNLDGENPNPTTFYLFENRQKEGFDKYLPGHGMLVTRIKYDQSRWDDNTLNNYSAANQGIAIQSAAGSVKESNRDTYPGSGKKTSYTPISGKALTNITEKDGLITFDYKNGVKTYSVKYVAGTLGKLVGDEQLTDQTEVVLPDVTANSGYKFVGWATGAYHTADEINVGKAGENYTLLGDQTLYAIYEEETNGLKVMASAFDFVVLQHGGAIEVAGVESKSEISIFNLLGQTIHSGLKANERVELEKGIYLVKVKQNNLYATKKIMVE